MSLGNGLLPDSVSYTWRIEQATRKLGQATMINSPSFTGAGRRWVLTLVARTADGIELDAMPLYVTVFDPTSLVVSAAMYASVLVGSGWSSTGLQDKRVIIDINENRMGTVLVDEQFMTRGSAVDYVNVNDDSLTIRCRIHVFDDRLADAFLPPPTRIPPALPGIIEDGSGAGSPEAPSDNRRKTRRNNSTTAVPAKRRRLQ